MQLATQRLTNSCRSTRNTSFPQYATAEDATANFSPGEFRGMKSRFTDLGDGC